MTDDGDGSIAGWYDDTGSPRLAFHIRGVSHEPPGLKYDGIIDTGFSGFIQVPLPVAFSLNLPLEGTTSVMLADGSTQTALTALGMVTLGNRPLVGVVHLSPSHEILLGMDFLRRFERALGVFRNNVFLLPEQPPATEMSKDD